MPQTDLRPETEATLLLCGSFGPTREQEPARPLNVGEFNALIDQLSGSGLGLADLLDPDARDKLGEAAISGRIDTLLQRTTALQMAAERWADRGFWVLDRDDPDYPHRWLQHLGVSAPPLLYGAGDRSKPNLEQQRVAVVGSREIDTEAEAFARTLGAAIAGIDAITVSGGARGVDRISIDGALQTGGGGIAILPGALEQVARSRAYRPAIEAGQFVAVSPYHPGAKFTAGNAMGRNRLIYCLADLAVVVESAQERGGTWTGATETLNAGWVPVGVRQSSTPSEGNQALIALGATPISPETIISHDTFRAWLTDTISGHQPPDETSGTQQLGLFG